MGGTVSRMGGPNPVEVRKQEDRDMLKHWYETVPRWETIFTLREWTGMLHPDGFKANLRVHDLDRELVIAEMERLRQFPEIGGKVSNRLLIEYSVVNVAFHTMDLGEVYPKIVLKS